MTAHTLFGTVKRINQQQCDYENVFYSADIKKWRYFYFDEEGNFKVKGKFNSSEQAYFEYKKRQLNAS